MKWVRSLFNRERNHRGRLEDRLLDESLDVGERDAIQRELTLKTSLDENLKTLRLIAGPSSDVVIRELKVGQAKAEAAVIHIQTLSEAALVEMYIRTLTIDAFQKLNSFGLTSLVFMGIIAFLQVSSSVRQQKWGELIAFGVIWTVATIYGLLVIAGVNVPKPAMLIIEFFESIGGKAGLR